MQAGGAPKAYGFRCPLLRALYLQGNNMKKFIIAAIISTLAFPLFANTNSPYVGQEIREIKALSQQQVTDYINGKGLGYAKAAELNQYPGPSHVLEAAKNLSLTTLQITHTKEIFDRMKEQASELGRLYIAKEQELDKSFSRSTIDSDLLKILITDIGELQASIRYVHLNAHIEQKALLTKHQIKLYDQLRGYSGPINSKHSHTQ